MQEVGFDPLFLELGLDQSQNGLLDRIVRIGHGHLARGLVDRQQSLVFVKDGDDGVLFHGAIIAR